MMDINQEVFNEFAKVTKESGEQIGAALKSISERLDYEPLKTALGNLNIEYENRELLDIFEDLSKVYKTMSEDSRVELAIKLGGKYNLARTSTILNSLNIK